MDRNQLFGVLLGLASLFGASAAFGQAAEAGSTSGSAESSGGAAAGAGAAGGIGLGTAVATGVVGAAVLGGIISEMGNDNNNPAAGGIEPVNPPSTTTTTTTTTATTATSDTSGTSAGPDSACVSGFGNKAQAVMLCAFLFEPWLVLCSADLWRAAKSCLHRAF